MSSSPAGAGHLERKKDNLALVFQELITVGERLRSNRQVVTDPNAFRAQIWEAVKQADQEARRRGYTAEDIELAIFAVVAFLDESILNLRSPVFADWPRQPLQEERYGHHIAGEIFFQNLQKMLGRNESQDLADLLEVYQLCLLLGFAGRYSIGNRGELRTIAQQTGEKIQRIRQGNTMLSPDAALPAGEEIKTGGNDPWVKRLMFITIGCLVLVIALFVLFQVMLRDGITTLKGITAAPAIQAGLEERA
jgi:type VI secretion system protein ImpK